MTAGRWLAELVFTVVLFWLLGFSLAIVLGLSRPYIHRTTRLCRAVVGRCTRRGRTALAVLFRRSARWLVDRLRRW